MEKFVVIDVETLSPNATSVCSIGVAVFENDRLVNQYYSLVCPPTSEEERWHLLKNGGIRYNDVKDSPRFDELWINHIFPLIKDCKYIVSHNNGTESTCLYELLDYYNISDIYDPINGWNWVDTLIEAKEKISISSYKLENVCYALDVSIKGHHNALVDAIACGECHIRMQEKKYIEVTKSTLLLPKYKYQVTKERHHVEPNNFPLYGKSICISGEFGRYSYRDYIKKTLNDLGVVVRTGVSKKLDLLICGDNPGPSKIEKAKEFGIKIETAEYIYNMLDGFFEVHNA